MTCFVFPSSSGWGTIGTQERHRSCTSQNCQGGYTHPLILPAEEQRRNGEQDSVIDCGR